MQTVLIINREDNNANAIIGSDLYVGDDIIPSKNSSCNALPTSSGAYSCAGKIGKYLGLYKKATLASSALNICQIRAYSNPANEFGSFLYFKSDPNGCEDQSNLIMKNEPILSYMCKMSVKPNQSGLAYFNIVFD